MEEGSFILICFVGWMKAVIKHQKVCYVNKNFNSSCVILDGRPQAIDIL